MAVEVQTHKALWLGPSTLLDNLESPIRLNNAFLSKKKGSKNFWIVGILVSTVGLDEHVIRQYINQKEEPDIRQMVIELVITKLEHAKSPPFMSLVKLPALQVLSYFI